jgi:peptide/nickel transport system substrate-binding protein
MKKLLLAVCLAGALRAQLRFALHDEPKTQDPFLVADESAEAIRYLTEGVLIRINRSTQKPEPELAVSWKISPDSARVEMQLRKGVKFPDGPPFTSRDVVESFRKLLDPALHSPIADTFKTAKGVVSVAAVGDYGVVFRFPGPTASIESMFDQVSIAPAGASTRPVPGLGAFLLAGRRPGASIDLKRNPAYWKHDAQGHQLPYLETIHIDIEQNRDLEIQRFLRGDLHLIDKLTPDHYDRLMAGVPGAAADTGPTLDSEFVWFNQAKRAPLRESAREWFQNAAFRRAISQAINRADLCRVVYHGHATAAAGPVSPANRLWFLAGATPDAYDPRAASRTLASAGFRLEGGVLKDSHGNRVEFSLITNSGSKTRERMAAMIQSDLKQIGIQVNVVTLDFPSLLERIARNLNYEVCLLGLVNVTADPSDLMNILISSASNHPWNPSEVSPETSWEAEIDKLMLAQAATADFHVRKKSFDRVQEILHEQMPVVYLLHPNALSAVSSRLKGEKAAVFYPHVFWDAEALTVAAAGPGRF